MSNPDRKQNRPGMLPGLFALQVSVQPVQPFRLRFGASSSVAATGRALTSTLEAPGRSSGALSSAVTAEETVSHVRFAVALVLHHLLVRLPERLKHFRTVEVVPPRLAALLREQFAVPVV